MYEAFSAAEQPQPMPQFWNRTALLRDPAFDEGGLRIAVAVANNVGYEQTHDKLTGLRDIARLEVSRFFKNIRLLREQVLISSTYRFGRIFWQPQPGLKWAVGQGVSLPGFERLQDVASMWDPYSLSFDR